MLKLNKVVTKSGTFLLAGICMTLALQKVMVPKWVYPLDYEEHTSRAEEFCKLSSKPIQAVFMGTSHVLYGVIPMEIYEESGIATYNLAKSWDHVDDSYYFLKSSLEKENQIKEVLLDVSTLFFPPYYEPAWRYTLDNMPLGKTKMEAAEQYKTYFGGAEEKNYIGALFPLYKYHTRWNQLNAEDLKIKSPAYAAKGFTLRTDVVANTVTEEKMNQLADQRAGLNGIYTTEYREGKGRTVKKWMQGYDPNPNEDALKWLKKMKELCDEHGVELRLFKVPTINDSRTYGSAWTKLRSEAIKKVAKDMNIPFYDLLYDAGLKMDIENDFLDGGGHCNFSGALKTSRCLGEYLKKECGLKPEPSEVYEKDLSGYRKIRQMGILQTEIDFREYCEKLKENWKKDSMIAITVNKGIDGFSKEDMECLAELGTKTDLFENHKDNSYMVLFDEGERKYEAVSEMDLHMEYDAGTQKLHDNIIPESMAEEPNEKGQVAETNPLTINMDSSGSNVLVNTPPNASIRFNGTEYCVNQPGINIVVYEKSTGKIVDSVNFHRETKEEKLKAFRGDITSLTKDYEYYIYDSLAGVQK